MRATHEPARMQELRLLDIVSRNRGTAFGKEHDFAGIRSVADLRARVPVRTYDEFEPFIKRMCCGEKRILTEEDPQFFGRTSGTTGAPKFIPVTPSYYNEFSKTQKMWQRKLVTDHPSMLRGKIFSIMSPEIDGYTKCGIPYGALSGHSYRLQYPITQSKYAVPYDVMCVRDFHAKYYLALRLALEEDVTVLAALNPSTILLLMKKLNTHAQELADDIERGTVSETVDITPRLRRTLEERLKPNKKRAREIRRLVADGGAIRSADVWKNLSIISTWQGGSLGFFLREFPPYFASVPARDPGLIATEGYFSIPLRSNSPEGLLAVTGHYMEFFPVRTDGSRSDEPLDCQNLEIGRDYFLVVTTSGGLYRYDIGDIVEVTDFFNRTPVIVFKHRGGNTVSITGEKVTETQVTEAMKAASSDGKITVEGFTVALQLGDPPSYLLMVETPEHREHVLATILERFENELRARNIEYVSKRDSRRLGEPSLWLLPRGFFEQCRRTRVEQGSFDGQYKLPQLMPDTRTLGDVRPVMKLAIPAGARRGGRMRA